VREAGGTCLPTGREGRKKKKKISETLTSNKARVLKHLTKNLALKGE
jgi:hypothetical protein